MAPSPKKSGAQAYPAELSLQPGLKNCLVNLPSALVNVLVESNNVAQNVIVELTVRQLPSQSSPGKAEGKSSQKSVYVGWTGIQSKPKLSSVIGREGLSGARGNASKEREVPVVEIDSTFAQLLGLADGVKVGILLHIDPPQAHTINIEPLSPADWEIIELHANFLEIHMLSQIRALPNPGYKGASVHPLTLHLTPTSTANVVVTSLDPAPSISSAFAKIGPDAEVIVAPKLRSRSAPSAVRDSQKTTSVGGKSGTSTARARSSRKDSSAKPMFLRGVARSIADDWFDDLKPSDKDSGIKVWVDRSLFTSKTLKGVPWVWVSIVRPAGLQAPLDPQQQAQQNTANGEQDTVKPAARIVAQLCAWEDAPKSEHVALSSSLCSMLDCECFVGNTFRLEPAPQQIPNSSIKTMKIYPFAARPDRQKDGFKFGGKSKMDREEAARRITAMYAPSPRGNGLLEGPLTDGMILPILETSIEGSDWAGGILKFDPLPGPPLDPAKSTRGWILGSERKLPLEVVTETTRPTSSSKSWLIGELLPSSIPRLVGIDALIKQLHSHITHMSSILLTGGLGAGKSTVAQLLGHRVQTDKFANITYFPCRTLVTDETRVSTIKDTLNRMFALAAWNARFGGYSLIILDDLDRLCPVETELQVGGENGRSRHISEMVISIVRQYCSRDSRVVLLATAQAKESVNNVIIGGHIVREILNLQAPDKEARRRVLALLVNKDLSSGLFSKPNGLVTPPPEPNDERGWLDGSSPGSIDEDDRQSLSIEAERNPTKRQDNAIVLDPSVDLLDVAGQTDGFMPGDLVQLISRVRSEALIRSISSMSSSASQTAGPSHLTSADFTSALKGFTPASLRNVTLQQSSTTFASIGGLKETRNMLLETLQYPTLYAPIFAKCPLRLRSGLLLYGYPGCGKTLLASAVAGECGLNFISIKGPEILNKYIGASEKSVRDLFERAQAARPCVLFFDEFDSVAPKRGHDSTGVTDRVVNQMLTQMDGAEGLSGVYVLAATSRPDLIDPALLRPGRLDKSLLCDMPSFEDRHDILRAVSKNLKLAPSVLANNDDAEHTLADIARRTEGYSGADLQAVIYNAHLEAIHDVLNDRGDAKPRKPGSTTALPTASPAASTPGFAYFRFGEPEEPNGGAAAQPPMSAAAKATERAEIAATLATYRQAQLRQRRLANQRWLSSVSPALGKDENGNVEDKRGTQEPVIEWVHMERALAQTRPSISAVERRRLAGIYREFLVGRNGEMPSGQGGSEIGGRSSLM